MSKKNLNSFNVPAVEGGYLIREWQIKGLEGRLLTMVESWGLKDTQEKSVKDLLRQEVWALCGMPCLYISSDDAAELQEKYNKMAGSLR